MDTPTIPRHRTAIERASLSRPIQLALADSIISAATTVLDYGCGRGGDVARLQSQGVSCAGWDPVHRPDGLRLESDVVNLGYVINTIEDSAERAEVVRAAWSLCRSVLIVSARLEHDARPSDAVLHADGYVTRLGTFQKLYQQHELRSFIDSTLNLPSLPAGPGVFYVFRDEIQRQALLFTRYRRLGAVPQIRRCDELYQRHKEALQPLLNFLCNRGRPPAHAELAEAQRIVEAFGSINRAIRVLRNAADPAQWSQARDHRTQDLLIFIALARFTRRPRFSDLPLDLQMDIRSFFTSYHAACELADQMLFSTGDMALVDDLFRKSKVGKLTPSALYVHRTALEQLDPILRLYEGCAQTYIGAVEHANLIKLHRGAPQVSYLSYPDFDDDPHPALHFSMVVPLQTFRVEVRHYEESNNPPILHRKEEFVAADYPLREKFARLTAQEVRYGLYQDPARIGTQNGWREVLCQQQVALRGHRVVRVRPASTTPAE